MPDKRQPSPTSATGVARSCEADGRDGVPTCETGPVGRYGFVYRELRDMLRRRLKAGEKK
ncbi:MAG: hypothetical protein NVS3B24_00690 [Candidatus Dormibacteria bacterium]